MEQLAIVPDAGGGFHCNGLHFKNRGHAVSYLKGKIRQARVADAAKQGAQHGAHPGMQMVPPYWPGYRSAQTVARAYVDAFCNARWLLEQGTIEPQCAKSAEG